MEVTEPLVAADHHSPTKRTGTTWTAVAHIITGVIGSGVLSLAWAMAQLGWIAGPFLMLFFAAITLFTSFLISDCYRSPDADHGSVRNRSYKKLFNFIWINFFGTGVAYIITSATCLRAIQRSNCYHKHGHDAPCEFEDSNAIFMLLFGVLQIFMSQIPDFHSVDWLSIIAAIMSFTYSSIGLGLGVANTIGNGVIEGSIDGISASTSTQKFWLVFQALGDIAFAYPFSMILLNIQDTLKSPPAESETMKRASVISIFVTTLFYLSCGGFGYAAFGDQTPGNLLTGFSFYEPYWLIDFANACIVLHLVGGYQMYRQPIYAMVDKWFDEQHFDNTFVTIKYTLKLPLLPSLSLNLQRMCSRTAYVASTTLVALIFPYFNEVLGVLGALNFWPVAIYFPVEMCLRIKNIESWTCNWILLQSFSLLCFILTVFVFVASIEGLRSCSIRLWTKNIPLIGRQKFMPFLLGQMC